MPYGLTDTQLQQVQTILAENNQVNEAIIFGSRAKGNYRPGSDVDIALKGSQLNLEDILKLANRFDESSLPYTFDLLIFDQIKNQELVEHIERVGIRIKP